MLLVDEQFENVHNHHTATKFADHNHDVHEHNNLQIQMHRATPTSEHPNSIKIVPQNNDQGGNCDKQKMTVTNNKNQEPAWTAHKKK